jgi:hypothetical protein
VGPRAGLDGCGKCHPHSAASSVSLYRLRCSCPHACVTSYALICKAHENGARRGDGVRPFVVAASVFGAVRRALAAFGVGGGCALQGAKGLLLLSASVQCNSH